MATFKEWYANPENRKALSEKRKALYRASPEVRKKYREYQAGYRQRVKGERPSFEGMTRDQTCEALGISTWTFNSWRSKGYFPSPKKILGRVSISERQRNLLGLLVEFHRSYGPKFSAQQKLELNNIVQVVHAHWEE